MASATQQKLTRRMPIGAEVMAAGGVHFRVWAPRRTRVEVVLADNDESATELSAEGNGYFSGDCAAAHDGSRYWFRLDGQDKFPDPASRFQPEGPHGPSQVVDASSFDWTDEKWPGVELAGQVMYEMHVGTFTPEGTWAAATRELAELARLGITVVELMPLADFAGERGWGYDGVCLFAPTRVYGTPDDFRRFVDEAHRVGIGVILDAVYNHFGPDGNYLRQFAEAYFTDRFCTEWGEAINFDDTDSHSVREFMLANAGYWVDEFHLDGLRLDATQSLFDSSADHIIAAIRRRVAEAARGRATIVVAENEPQNAVLARSVERGGYGLDGLWNDDFHHLAHVALTGHNEAYYTDYAGAPQEFISALKRGFLYQGQLYGWQEKRRGTPALDLSPPQFINFLQNHDQVANSLHGARMHELASPAMCRALTAVLLLGPGTPLLFQGQEFAASAPFCYFVDHTPELNDLVRQGRTEFLRQFPSIAACEGQNLVPDPAAVDTFARCRLDLSERESHKAVYQLHGDLLRLRREDPTIRLQGSAGIDGAVLGPAAFVIRFFGAAGDDRLLIVNLGNDLHLQSAPEPLLAPPRDQSWQAIWSSELPDYGGAGLYELETKDNWWLPGHAATLLAPSDESDREQGVQRATTQVEATQPDEKQD